MRNVFGSARGKMNPAMMFLIAAGALLVAAGVFFMTQRKTEEKKRSHIGELGRVANFTLEREAGINLPFADQAVAGSASADTTIEIPIEWKDVQAAKDALAARYDAMEKKLTRSGEVYDETVTLRVDREAPYRMLYLAVLAGVDHRFVKLQVPCYPSGESREVRYLRIEPPTEFTPGKNVLLFRLLHEGPSTRYIFGVSKIKEFTTLKQAAEAMKNTPKDADKVLVLWPSLDTPVQNVVEALNAATYAGFQKITLNLAKVE